MAGPYLPNLSTTPTVPSNWYFVGFQGNNNNGQRMAMQVLVDYLLNPVDTVQAVTVSDGNNIINVNSADGDIWILVTPDDTDIDVDILIVMPLNPVDQQRVTVSLAYMEFEGDPSSYHITVDGNVA